MNLNRKLDILRCHDKDNHTNKNHCTVLIVHHRIAKQILTNTVDLSVFKNDYVSG